MRSKILCFPLFSSWFVSFVLTCVPTVNAGEYKALCNDVDCKISITEKGFSGPNGFVDADKIYQWYIGSDSYNVPLGATGGVVGGSVGFAAGTVACFSGVFCPAALAIGILGGGKLGSNIGNSNNFSFTIAAKDIDEKDVVQNFRFINRKPARKVKKELTETTGLEMGQLRQ